MTAKALTARLKNLPSSHGSPITRQAIASALGIPEITIRKIEQRAVRSCKRAMNRATQTPAVREASFLVEHCEYNAAVLDADGETDLANEFRAEAASVRAMIMSGQV
jgi:hypothetical protein